MLNVDFEHNIKIYKWSLTEFYPSQINMEIMSKSLL